MSDIRFASRRVPEAENLDDLPGFMLLTLCVHGRGHAAENLPRAVSANSRVRDPHASILTSAPSLLAQLALMR